MKNNEKTTKKQRKERIISFRLTLQDLCKYEEFCIREQLQLSEWLRKTIRSKIDSLPETNFIHSQKLSLLCRVVGKIGYA